MLVFILRAALRRICAQNLVASDNHHLWGGGLILCKQRGR